MTTLQEKFYREIKSMKNRILNFQEVSMRMAKTVEVFTKDVDFVIIPHKRSFDIRAIEKGTNRIIHTADFMVYRTTEGMKTKLLNRINRVVHDYTESQTKDNKKEIDYIK